MKPIYIENFAVDFADEALGPSMGWTRRTDTRKEQFWATTDQHYSYGTGRGVRSYSSVPEHPIVTAIRRRLLYFGTRHNVCFGNRYEDERQHLGWHSDDSPSLDPNHWIDVVTFGWCREIQIRPLGFKGQIPSEWRFPLANGSLFRMPAGMQASTSTASQSMAPPVALG